MKEEKNDRNDKEIDLNEYTKRLLELYDRKNRDFERYFAILLGISIIIFFLLILPYVSTQDLKHRINQDLNANIQRIAENEDKYLL